MRTSNAAKPATAETVNGLRDDRLGGAIERANKPDIETRQVSPGAGDRQSTKDRRNGAVRGHRRALIGYLKAKCPPRAGSGRDNYYHYDIVVDGRLVVCDSHDPECDLARALLAEGIAGAVALHDAVTGKPRVVINIEKAAKLTVEESRTRGPRFSKWKPGTFVEWLTREREGA